MIKVLSALFSLLLGSISSFFALSSPIPTPTPVASPSFSSQLQDAADNIHDKIVELRDDLERFKIKASFSRTLKRGQSGEDVKKLQEILASLEGIYPNGPVTGYFSSLTEKAVKEFQKQNDLKPTGVVDGETKNALVEASIGDKSFDKDFFDEEVDLLKLASTSFSKPKKKSKAQTPASASQDFETAPAEEAAPEEVASVSAPAPSPTPPPAGGSTTTSTSAPTPTPIPTPSPTPAPITISGVTNTSVTNSRQTISWVTNVPADSEVDYGTTTSYGDKQDSSSLVTSHTITLSGLKANTVYHYQVKSKDSKGNIAVSGDNTFQTVK